MQESLITFETSKLAKEKGFNIDQVIIHSYNKGLEESLIKGISQSLLQKWLREVHNIDIVICPHGQIVYRCRIYKNGLLEQVFGLELNYEILLEEGLQKGLKLIPEIT